MSKDQIHGITHRLTASKYHMPTYNENAIGYLLKDIREEERAREKANKQPDLGPKMRVKKLLELGFPDEEAIKRIKKDFDLDDDLIRKWIKELKIEIKKDKIAKRNTFSER